MHTYIDIPCFTFARNGVLISGVHTYLLAFQHIQWN